jgi:hypothetical protein
MLHLPVQRSDNWRRRQERMNEGMTGYLVGRAFILTQVFLLKPEAKKAKAE